MCPKHGKPDDPVCDDCEVEYHLSGDCGCSRSKCRQGHCVSILCKECES